MRILKIEVGTQPPLLDRMPLEILMGPMYSGKSSAAQHRIRRAQAIRWPVYAITHSMDTRYSATPMIVSHDQTSLPARASTTLMPHLESPEFLLSKLVVIEEAQFFPDLVEFVDIVVDKHRKECVVVGLDGDAERKPIGHILRLVPRADKIEKLTALCRRCGNGTPAPFTHASSADAAAAASSGVPCVGAEERYQPLCRAHYLEAVAPPVVSTVQHELGWGC